MDGERTMAMVRILCTTDKHRRSTLIDARLREAWGEAFLIVPTRGQAKTRMEALLLDHSMPGLFGRPVCEFNEFVKMLLAADGKTAVMLSSLERQLILEECLHALGKEGKLSELPGDAVTPGLVRHLLSIINRLKQAEKHPEQFFADIEKLPEKTPQDMLVTAVYSRYQEALTRYGLHDIPGLYWQAAEAFEEKRPELLRNIRLIALDGFDDFTPSQITLIRILASYVPEMHLGMHADLNPTRSDLFSLQQDTIQKLQHTLTIATVQTADPESDSIAAFAANHLLDRDPPAAPDKELRPNLLLKPCLNLLHEIQHIAREVKRLLREESVSPWNIAITFADFDTARTPLAAVLAAQGVPYCFHTQPPLQESALAGWILQLLESMSEWPRSPILELVTSPFYRPEGLSDTAKHAFPLIAREAGITAGREEWIFRLDRFIQHLSRKEAAEAEAHETALPLPDALEAAQALKEAAARLTLILAAIPEKASLKAYAQVLTDVMRQAGIASLLERESPPDSDAASPIGRREKSALKQLQEVISTLYDTPVNQRDWSRGEFTALLRRTLMETPWVHDTSATGVACGAPALLRGASYDYIFVGGMNEGVFPRPAAINAVYNGEDLARLARLNIVRLDGSSEQALRERMLFHHILESAKNHLTITWRLQQPDGKEALESPFVVELKELTHPWRPLANAEPPQITDLIASPSAMASPEDLFNAYAFLNLNAPLPGYESVLDYMASVTRIESERQAPTPFGVYDGVLSAADTRAWIADRYGAAHHFSVSRIEQYLACPYTYFEQVVLGIAETRLPTEALEPLVKGLILHDTMERFFESVPALPLNRRLADEQRENSFTALARCLEEAFRRYDGRMPAIPGPLKQAEQQRMLRQLTAFLEKHVEYLNDDLVPTHFEVSFGKVRGEHEHTLSTPSPYRLEGAAEPIHLSGKIDRIDLHTQELRLIDYKTGAVPSGADIYSGRDLQLTVYAWAAEQLLLPAYRCIDAIYCSLTKNKAQSALGIGQSRSAAKWADREKKAREQIETTVSRIRQGFFPPVPAGMKSQGCPASGRFSKARIERKKAAMGWGGASDAEGNEE